MEVDENYMWSLVGFMVVSLVGSLVYVICKVDIN